MWEAMQRAALGWALVGEDPAVNELEQLGAKLLGKETALLVPTCSAANLLALLSLTRPGEQVVLESAMHLVWSEGQSLAFPAGLFPILVEGIRGAPSPGAIEAALTVPHFGHLGQTTLVCLENTHTNAGGSVLPPTLTANLAEIAHRHGAAVHLDGARLFNAAVALGCSVAELAAPVDTVAISLNKGLGAPEGALLAGPSPVIGRARGHAKRFGLASWHKAGIAAAAGLVALTTMVDRLAEDHRRAAELARRLAILPGVKVEPEQVQTNIVLIGLADEVVQAGFSAPPVVRRLRDEGILALARSDRSIRFVTHRLITDDDVANTAAAVEQTMAKHTVTLAI
jgi:threonine aldolase